MIALAYDADQESREELKRSQLSSFLAWKYPRFYFDEKINRRIQILKELGKDVIVEEQSDNFDQSSSGQASQTEAQRLSSGFGRLHRKIKFFFLQFLLQGRWCQPSHSFCD